MEADLRIALRDSETASRPYVLVNPMLAKHLPVAPSLALDYFMQLGKKVADICKNERVLVIGFAETATAVGAAVAAAIDGAVYVHTTRELSLLQDSPDTPQSNSRLVAEFFEEHSHAKNQSLYLNEIFRELSAYDRIVFVEDEITTGKTIRNFLQNIEYSGKIIVSALVFNGFDQGTFSQYDADFVCLQKVGYAKYLDFDGLPNPRSGVYIDVYREKCSELASHIIGAIDQTQIQNKDVLVVGTEEFMYPVLILGRELEKSAQSVKTHSTTRSPLLLRDYDEYPLYSKYSFESVYDSARMTYLYNLKKYDTVIIVTDAPVPNDMQLIHAIQNCASQTIYFVRVKNAN